MDELKRNGSGYYDPTAYKALKSIEGGQKMKSGEIWEVEVGKAELATCLVIAANERFSSILLLTDESKSEDDIEVIARCIKYTNPMMLSYKFNSCFATFVKAMKDDEFATLKEVIAGKLGLNVAVADEEGIIALLKNQNENMKKDMELLFHERNELKEKLTFIGNQPVIQHDPEELVILKAQVEMLEKQNEKLLDRLIG